MKEIFVKQARSWIGTKFHHQGRLKKTEEHFGGCDCIGLVIGVAKELNFTINNRKIDSLDNKNYQRLVKTPILLDIMNCYLKKKTLIEVGDIALFTFGAQPQHVGIIGKIGDNFTIIHAYLKIGFVVEHILDKFWLESLHSLYEFNN